MKVAIVVQGRFHAFDLARGLRARGHDVTVFTNYPRWAGQRFGLDPASVTSFAAHGVLSRLVGRFGTPRLRGWWERAGSRWFGRWAARRIGRRAWDVIHCWSGVSEELLAARTPPGATTFLMRGSSHIRTQRRLLDEESARAQTPLERPSDWMVARELREYALADRVMVLSSFAARTFLEEGVPESRVVVLPLGVEIEAFRPDEATRTERVARIRRGDPLAVLYVGTLSYRKGFLDLASAVRLLDASRFRFSFVGPVLQEVVPRLSQLGDNVSVPGRVPEADLPGVYARGDIFLFPTIEDGFAMVLAQAKAAGLPVVTTPNSAGSDLVEEGRDGWIVPIRDAAALAERLRWCDANREALAGMAGRPGQASRSRDWMAVAADFERIVVAHPGGAEAAAPSMTDRVARGA